MLFNGYYSTNSIEFLVDVLEVPVVTPAVRDDIEQGVDFDHEYLTSAVEAFDDELTVSDVLSRSRYADLKREACQDNVVLGFRGTCETKGRI